MRKFFAHEEDNGKTILRLTSKVLDSASQTLDLISEDDPEERNFGNAIMKYGSCYGVLNPELIGIEGVIPKSTLGALSG